MSEGAKYDTDDGRWIDDDVALTDHALHRWQQRTPHDCPVTIRQAWERGEWIQHPEVCQSDSETAPPTRVRVYRHSEEWGVAYLLDCDISTFGAPEVVATVINLNRFDHAPTQAYLRAHGIHGPGETDA